MIASITSSLRFFARNLWCGRKLQAIPPTRFGAFIIEPLSAKNLTAARDLYLMLNPGARLGIAQMLILRLLGPRLCLIARPAGDRHAGIAAQAPGRGPQNPAVAAVTLFYFNPRDRNEGTIHAAYNGLHPSAQGAGLGTFLLRHALENFARLGLAGASSRVSISNRSALKANEKAGFIPLETYFDIAAGEERHYLVCDLGRYRPITGLAGVAEMATEAHGNGHAMHGQNGQGGKGGKGGQNGSTGSPRLHER